MGVNGWNMLELEWIREIETCPWLLSEVVSGVEPQWSTKFFHQWRSHFWRPERLILGELESRLHLDVKVLLSPGSPESLRAVMVYDGL